MKKIFLIIINFILFSIIICALFFIFSQKNEIFAENNHSNLDQNLNTSYVVEIKEKIEEIKKEKPPEREVRGLYLTANSAGNSQKLDQIINSIKSSAVNALVIDLKSYGGEIVYDSQIKIVKDLHNYEILIKDLPALIKKLHDLNFYVIGRISVFEDLNLAQKKPEWAIKNKKTGGIWYNNKGLAWTDPTNEEVWQYNVDIAKEAISLGFDEINFDYIRFPSDGELSVMVFKNFAGKTKREVIKSFFEFISNELKDKPAYISVDLFGLTTVMEDDMNIGQNIEDAAPYVDYISPMVYPSHYYPGYLNFKNPADHPYEIISYDLKIANERLAKLKDNKAKIRPWLQAFNLGAKYTPQMIDLEIKAAKENGGFGYLLWNAGNIYNYIPQ